MRVSLWCCLLVLVSCQVSPTWLESAYVETKVVYLVDNHQKTSGTYFQNSTYTKPLTNPQVCLCNCLLIQPSSSWKLFLTPTPSGSEAPSLLSSPIDSPTNFKSSLPLKCGIFNSDIWPTTIMLPCYRVYKSPSITFQLVPSIQEVAPSEPKLKQQQYLQSQQRTPLPLVHF